MYDEASGYDKLHLLIKRTTRRSHAPMLTPKVESDTTAAEEDELDEEATDKPAAAPAAAAAVLS